LFYKIHEHQENTIVVNPHGFHGRFRGGNHKVEWFSQDRKVAFITLPNKLGLDVLPILGSDFECTALVLGGQSELPHWYLHHFE
jgi:hypothetical protein